MCKVYSLWSPSYSAADHQAVTTASREAAFTVLDQSSIHIGYRMTGSVCHCLCSQGDYPVTTLWQSRSQQRSPQPDWVVLHSVWPDGVLFVPTTGMGQKVVWEWGRELVDVDFRFTSTASTSLAVGELLQLVVLTALLPIVITMETQAAALTAQIAVYGHNSMKTCIDIHYIQLIGISCRVFRTALCRSTCSSSSWGIPWKQPL